MFVCVLKCDSGLDLSFSDKKKTFYICFNNEFISSNFNNTIHYIDISNSEHVDEGTIDIYI